MDYFKGFKKFFEKRLKANHNKQTFSFENLDSKDIYDGVFGHPSVEELKFELSKAQKPHKKE